MVPRKAKGGLDALDNLLSREVVVNIVASEGNTVWLSKGEIYKECSFFAGAKTE